MAKCASIITSQISSISKKELERLVLKAAAKDKSFHDYLLVNYFDKEFGEQDLFQQAKEDLDKLFNKNYHYCPFKKSLFLYNRYRLRILSLLSFGRQPFRHKEE